ncbi:hypothetical protein [Paractinoplanes lichenicola]|uniref:Uncharacterized protein n=1 Tax=Paractinoplanes lichenicola TaxID=2802976 RepID=A0ABS1VF32_9ACTN|nr:hypothetical protein [Actinoplanes lichenicola]MBL7253284.1 hypothetical protein [Actinoplanes lichenicola]
MTALTIARTAAVLTAVGTVGYLFPAGLFRTDNIFLIPDLLLSLLLLLAAAAPARYAVTDLLCAFCFAGGVLVTAVSWYAVDGRVGPGALLGAVTSAVMAAVLIRRRPA